MTERYEVGETEALQGDVDLAATIARIPEHFSMRGMFFSRYVAALGAEWEELLPTLEEPAKHGKYHAFESYPMRDYLRLFGAVAKARFPGSTREAFRLLARGEVEVFAGSTLGKVTFSLLRDPGAALVRYPEIFNAVIRGPQLSSERMGPRRVVISNKLHLAAIEQTLGVLEGLVQAFEETPRVAVSVDDDRSCTFDVAW